MADAVIDNVALPWLTKPIEKTRGCFVVDSFRAAVISSGSQAYAILGKSGSAPTPFDAVDSARLAGPQGSHPLASIDPRELVRSSSGGFDGAITINEPVRIGEAIAGHLRLTARKDINARNANVRLVGVLLAEHEQSYEERNDKGEVVRSERWVDVSGSLIEELPFTEPLLPTTLSAGETFETDFNLPAPRLGPPSAHMGSAILAWALDARWDISMGGDERVSALVDVKQNIDYLRSGAVRLEAGALFDAWSVGDGTIAVSPLPPVVAGSGIDVTVTWPGAGAGRGGRLELQADVKAPNSLSGVVLFSQVIDPSLFRGGTTVRIPIPADSPPTLDDKGVAVNYRIRALVDRKLRSDLSVERSIAVM
jgi:hypothetical protein